MRRKALSTPIATPASTHLPSLPVLIFGSCHESVLATRLTLPTLPPSPQIKSEVSYITKKYTEFTELVRDAPKPMTEVYRRRIESAFDFTVDHTDQLSSYFTGSPGPTDPAGVLAVFATFATTQSLPLLKLQYDNYLEIYGSTPAEVIVLRRKVLERSIKTIADSDAFAKRTAASMVVSRSSKISRPKFSSSCSCSMCERRCKCCNVAYSFRDELTGQEFRNSDTTYDDKEGGDLLTNALNMRRLVVDRVESASRINIYQSTASRPLWPLLVAGGSGKALKTRIVVEKNLCFSNWVDCQNGGVGMPSGHSYQDYNISDITLRSGSWVDYISVTYTHRSSGQKLQQEFGNRNGGSTPSDGTLQNLLTNPVVKAAWWSESISELGVGKLSGVQFTQANGRQVRAGKQDSKSYTDDFGLWKGNVWLCGMHIHGDAGSRVHGIAPHWCYTETFTVQAPLPPSPPPSPPPPCWTIFC